MIGSLDSNLPKEIFRETNDLQTRYAPFKGWSRKPYNGQFVTIDSLGNRVNGSAINTDNNVSIHFYGGSTIWGTGVSDEQTIPSYFQRISNIETMNFENASCLPEVAPALNWA